MKLAWIQGKSQGSIEANADYYIAKIKKAAESNPGLILMPELFLADYFAIEEKAENFQLAMKLDHPQIQRFIQLTLDLQITLALPIFEKRSSAVFHNSCLILERGQIISHYRKMHIPDDPGFYEKYYFSPGDLGFQVAPTTQCKLGVLICWDQWFPEAARITALKGADLIYYPTAIAWDINEDPNIHQTQLEAWITIMRGHAIANNVHIVAVNRVGQEGHLKFWGHSFCVNPDGTILKLDQTEEAISHLEIDLEANQARRIAWPYMRDRRIDQYSEIQKLWVDS